MIDWGILAAVFVGAVLGVQGHAWVTKKRRDFHLSAAFASGYRQGRTDGSQQVPSIIHFHKSELRQ